MSENPLSATSELSLSSFQWFWKGARSIVSLPALILMLAFIGFGSLAREAGLTVTEAMVLAVSTWALPSAVVLVGAILDEVPFYAAVFAVMLASVRLMPMTMSLIPIMRAEKTKSFHLVIASNFIAITAWVYAMKTLPTMPREVRLPFFLGFGVTLAVVNTVITGLSHMLATSFPAVIAAGLLFLTPTYFLISMSGAARNKSEHISIIFGLILGPVFHLITPNTDLLWCGLVGGTLAYFTARLVDMTRQKPS